MMQFVILWKGRETAVMQFVTFVEGERNCSDAVCDFCERGEKLQ